MCASPSEPQKGTLAAAPLHIRVRDALSRALPTVRLFGFAVGYSSKMDYKYDFMERDTFLWWKRVEGSEGEDRNVGDRDNLDGGPEQPQWQRCFVLPGEEGWFMSNY